MDALFDESVFNWVLIALSTFVIGLSKAGKRGGIDKCNDYGYCFLEVKHLPGMCPYCGYPDLMAVK